MFNKILGIALLIASSQAIGQWCHDERIATDGSSVRLDYTVADFFSRFTGQIKVREATWINLKNESISPDAAVQFVFLRYFGRAPEGNLTHTYILDAEYATDTQEFYAAAPANTPIISEQFPSNRYYNEVAVVVDGEWLKTTRNPNSSNFLFDATAFADNGFCVNPY